MNAIQPTINLLQRVKGILGSRAEFFEVLCQWYADVRLGCRAARVLLRTGHALANTSLAINGCLLATADSWRRHPGRLTWILPASELNRGSNRVDIQWRPSDRTDLHVWATSVWQDRGEARGRVNLADIEPRCIGDLGLLVASGVEPMDGRWVVRPGGTIAFRLEVKQIVPVTFTLELAEESVYDPTEDVKEIVKDVWERVQEKKHELEERRRHERDGQSRVREDAIRALDSYMRLHVEQIEPALGSPVEVSLQEVLTHLDPPAPVVHDAAPAPRLRPRPKPRRPARATKPIKAASGSGLTFGKVLAFLFVPLVIAGVVLANNPQMRADLGTWFTNLSRSEKDIQLMRVLHESAEQAGWQPQGDGIDSMGDVATWEASYSRELDRPLTLPNADADTKMYWVTREAPNGSFFAQLGEGNGLAIWDHGSEAAAEAHFESMRKGGFGMGEMMHFEPLDVAGADDSLAPRLSDLQGAVVVLQPWPRVRVGQYILYAVHPIGDLEWDLDQDRRSLEILTAKLRRHLGK